MVDSGLSGCCRPALPGAVMVPDFTFLFLFIMDLIAALVGIVVGMLMFFVFGFGGWPAIIAGLVPIVTAKIWAFSKRK